MKKRKKILSLLLTIVVLITIMPFCCASSDSFNDIRVNSTVTFGSYEQDNNASDGKESIEWIVLSVNGSEALLISRYALECKKYNETLTDVTWETCTLRNWLNHDFLAEAFNDEELAAIETVSVLAHGNSLTKGTSDAGNSTHDRVFLLSIKEAEKYFSSDSARKCEATVYAASKSYLSTHNDRSCMWWLRTPGTGNTNVAWVSDDGGILYDGRSVSDDRQFVRPALWINLEMISAGSGSTENYNSSDSEAKQPEDATFLKAEGLLFNVSQMQFKEFLSENLPEPYYIWDFEYSSSENTLYLIICDKDSDDSIAMVECYGNGEKAQDGSKIIKVISSNSYDPDFIFALSDLLAPGSAIVLNAVNPSWGQHITCADNIDGFAIEAGLEESDGQNVYTWALVTMEYCETVLGITPAYSYGTEPPTAKAETSAGKDSFDILAVNKRIRDYLNYQFSGSGVTATVSAEMNSNNVYSISFNDIKVGYLYYNYIDNNSNSAKDYSVINHIGYISLPMSTTDEESYELESASFSIILPAIMYGADQSLAYSSITDNMVGNFLGVGVNAENNYTYNNYNYSVIVNESNNVISFQFDALTH